MNSQFYSEAGSVRFRTGCSGFTLIELILVVVLMAILAITVGPRLFKSQDYAPHHVQAKMISVLRSTQLKAMQQRGFDDLCHRVILRNGEWGNPVDMNQACDDLGDIGTSDLATDFGIGSQGEVLSNVDNIVFSFSEQGLPASIRFDGLGRPTEACDGGCIIKISGSHVAAICIEAEGYVHDC